MKQQSKSPGFINWGFRVSGLIPVLIGGYWLIAWLDGIAGQLSVQGSATGTVIMKTNMALSQLLAGLTILLIGIKTRYRLIHITATILAGIVFFTGFLTLGEYLLHFDLGIDQIITKELPGAVGTSSLNQMGLTGAFCITLLGAGLLFILGNRRKYASRLGIIICLIILVPSVGYLLDIHTFFSKPLSTGIAWPTVVSLTALGAGLIFSNYDGIIAIFFSNEPGGLLLRRLLPAILLIPLILGFLVIRGHNLNLFDIQTGTGGLVIAVIILFLILAILTARAINKTYAALQESEEKYRMIVELSMEGIVIGRPDGIIQFVNKRFADMLGYDQEEIIGKSGSEFFYDQEQVVDVKATRKHLQSGEVMQKDFKFRRKNGSLLYTLYNATPIFDSDGIHIGNLAMHSDITERKNAEEALKKSEERLKQALESGNIGIWDLDLKTNAAFWDERTEKMFGLDRGEFGQTYSSFADFVHEEDMHLIEKSLKDTLENDLPFESIYRIKTKTGALRYISSKGHLLKDNEGRPVKISGVCSDITDLKVGSEKLISKINEELLRSNKELENFAYIASHDLQEPLRMVSSFSQLLEMKYKDKLDSQALEYIQFSVEGSRRMYDLLNGLLAYSRIHTKGKEFDRVDLNKVLEDAIKCLTLKIQERDAIIRSADLPHVRGDYSQLILLFQNIISNGIKFNSRTPRINVSVTSVNDYYQISVKDNGIGIDPAYFEKIFQMFQRLLPKDQYEGTGIGLAICRRIVERHGGTIWVGSEPGKGSVFSFTIPK